MGAACSEDRDINNLFSKDFCQQYATSFGLDGKEFYQMLGDAADEHEMTLINTSYNEDYNAISKSLVEFKSYIEKAYIEWDKILPADKDKLDFFSCAVHGDKISENIVWIKDVVEEFDAYYKKRRGNDGKSRSNKELSLKGLYAFAKIIICFFEKNNIPTDKKFDANFENEDSDPDMGEFKPTSPFAIFFFKCANRLQKGYDAKNCQTVLDKLLKTK